jgi:hypothetical protein
VRKSSETMEHSVPGEQACLYHAFIPSAQVHLRR